MVKVRIAFVDPYLDAPLTVILRQHTQKRNRGRLGDEKSN